MSSQRDAGPVHAVVRKLAHSVRKTHSAFAYGADKRAELPPHTKKAHLVRPALGNTAQRPPDVFVQYCLYKILTLSFLFAVRVHIDELRTDFVEEISNYEPWPVLDLCIYLSHVLTDDSQTEKL